MYMYICICSPSASVIVIVAVFSTVTRGLGVTREANKLMTSLGSTIASSRIITLAHCLKSLGAKVSTVVKGW